MAIVLLDTDCEELWRESREQAKQADPEDESDLIAECPSILGEGYKRDIELRNGIDLTFHRYQLKEDFIVDWTSPEETNCLEWVFVLSSGFEFPQGVQISQGQHLLSGLVSPGGQLVGLADRTTVEIDIHLSLEQFQMLIGDRFDRLPTDLHRMLSGDEAVPFSPVRAITPVMHLALQQMLDCPYQGALKQMYLESKSIEVLALWLEQADSSDRRLTPRTIETERIYQAKDILLKHIDNPPSLLNLARQVGLNDCTLKREFKQVFGTTVFGYLHQCRMEQARSLLLDRQLTVTEIARQVGYTNLSAFSTAFRKQYGVSPTAMQQ